jgi:uncharacterized delta-60 repeat protein
MKNMKSLILIIAAILAVNSSIFAQTGTLPADFDGSFGSNGLGFEKSTANGYADKVVVDSKFNIYHITGFEITKFHHRGYQEFSVLCPLSACSSIAIDGNDNIFVAGYNSNHELSVAKLSSFTGNLIQNFGSNGIAYSKLDRNRYNLPRDLLIYRDKIVVVGYSFDNWVSFDYSNARQFLARFNEDGNQDTTFGVNGGFLMDSIGFSNKGETVAMQEDNIVVGGTSYTQSIGSFSTISVFDDAGRKLPSFNAGQSKQVLGFYTFVTVDSMGRIVFLGGEQPRIFGMPQSGGRTITRLNPDGSFDTTFGNNGSVIFPNTGYGVYFKGLAIDSLDRILFTGYDAAPSNPLPFIARYTTDGRADETFNNSLGSYGIIPVKFGNNKNRYLGGVAFQKNKIIFSGASSPSNSPYVAETYMFRLNGNN